MSTEVRVQRRLTTAFINTQPISLSLVPRDRVETPSGGRKWEDGAPRVPQTMRLVEPVNPSRPTRTLDGVERVVEYLLLGQHDADIGLYDTFMHAGARWEVVFLYHENGWERRAEVARHG